MSGLRDAGFADRDAAREAARGSTNIGSAHLRRLNIKLVVRHARASAKNLFDLLQEASEPVACDGSAGCDEAVRLAVGDGARSLSDIGVRLRHSDAVREQELLEGVDLVAQLFDQIEASVRHGLFSVVDGVGDGK